MGSEIPISPTSSTEKTDRAKPSAEGWEGPCGAKAPTQLFRGLCPLKTPGPSFGGAFNPINISEAQGALPPGPPEHARQSLGN